jgi:hypothetical protein
LTNQTIFLIIYAYFIKTKKGILVKHLLKISFLVSILCVNSIKSCAEDFVAPLVGGMAAGYVYERSLYRLPVVLAIPTVLGALATHALSAATFFDGDQTIVTAVAASLTALALYMREQAPQKQEIIIIEQQDEAPRHHRHHHHGHHGHYHHSAEIEVEVG